MASGGHEFYYVKAGKLHFFCPLCHYHQSTNTIEKVSWKHHAQLVLATLAITLFTWSFFGLKALSFYLVLWAGFEFFYRARKREALICQSCGFDPFLYMRDRKKARSVLKKQWQEKIDKENLFAGVKLKNYKTNIVKKDEAASAAASATPLQNSAPQDAGKNPPSAPAP